MDDSHHQCQLKSLHKLSKRQFRPKNNIPLSTFVTLLFPFFSSHVYNFCRSTEGMKEREWILVSMQLTDTSHFHC